MECEYYNGEIIVISSDDEVQDNDNDDDDVVFIREWQADDEDMEDDVVVLHPIDVDEAILAGAFQNNEMNSSIPAEEFEDLTPRRTSTQAEQHQAEQQQAEQQQDSAENSDELFLLVPIEENNIENEG